VISTLTSYVEGPGFKFHLGDRLSRLMSFMVFPEPLLNAGIVLELGHYRFLPYSSRLITHRIIRHSTVWDTASLVKNTGNKENNCSQSWVSLVVLTLAADCTPLTQCDRPVYKVKTTLLSFIQTCDTILLFNYVFIIIPPSKYCFFLFSAPENVRCYPPSISDPLLFCFLSTVTFTFYAPFLLLVPRVLGPIWSLFTLRLPDYLKLYNS
jgi:hypothetical protein